MSWYLKVKKDKKTSLRAMDFGCGTGLLVSKIIDPDIFDEIVGVDVADGMIEVFQEKIKRKDFGEIKMAAKSIDLSEINLKQLNSSITTDVKNLDTGFDLIFALLAFHHLKTPETMLNQVLKDNYLNPGGRILIMDYERDPKKQIFHPIHLINGEHYEHDGFTEKIVRDWFEKGNTMEGTERKWDLDTLTITKVPFLCPVDPVWFNIVPKRVEETYNMLMITCCTKPLV